ncbi:MAG TPA: prephenate dehydratase domain-containing protein [Gemmatimonadaceae bacterium]|nr:prephenate dehydratase domain-containing protein [Gemmatimonadaceae bacterium]
MTTTIAYQGEPGAFSEAAIAAAWGEAVVAMPCASFGDVIAAVESGRADGGLLPVANSIAGAVTESVGAIEGSTLVVVGETALPIHLDLLAVDGATLESLRTVESHPVALRQCRNFLGAHSQLEAVPSHDTAGAARAVAASGDRRRAAVASARAGALYGLITLASAIEDQAGNVTRFAIVARAESPILLSALDAQAPAANLRR